MQERSQLALELGQRLVFRARAERKHRRPCAECVKKQYIESSSVLCLWITSWFGYKLCLCINPQASLPPKAAPIVPQRDPTPLPSTLNQWSEITRWLACFCHCNEAKPRPEVLAVRFPNTLWMLKPLRLWNIPTPSLPPSITHPRLSTNSRVCLNEPRLSILPSTPPSSCLFFLVHKESLPHLDCACMQWWRLRQQLAVSAREG